VGLGYHAVRHLFNLPPADHAAALALSAVDASVTAEPLAQQAVASGIATLWPGALYPRQQIEVLLYGGSFIARRPALARRFLAAYRDGAGVLMGLLDGDRLGTELAALANARLPLKDASAYRAAIASAIDPQVRIDRESIARDLAFFESQNFIDGPVALASLFDPSVAPPVEGR
jgi:NitT/TauT family transport system substrate-binding protein